MDSTQKTGLFGRFADLAITSSVFPSAAWVISVVGFALLYLWFFGDRPHQGIPVIKLKEEGFLKWFKPLKFQMIFRAPELFELGKKTGTAFQVRAASAWKIVLPNRFAEEIRNHPDLKFDETQHIEFPTTLPGWEGMNEGLRRDGLFSDLVRIKLTQSLNLITHDMVDETDDATRRWLSDDCSTWKTYQIKPIGFDIVARITSRVFAGKKLSRNKDYLRIAKENTATSFVAGYKLHTFPKFLWPLLNWIMPECKTVRRQFKEATDLLRPSIESTIQWYKEDEAKKGPKKENAIGWMIEVQKGRPMGLKNFVGAQLSLSMASMENTFMLVGFCLVAVIENPEVVEPLREDMIRVLKEHGWSKNAFQKMKLLDSFVKEAQRTNSFPAIMNRYVQKTTVLSDGTVLPAGSMTLVLDDGTQDPNIYPKPEKFIADRYLRMREKPGAENRHQLVSLSADNLAFGLGNHSCPGRFFVHEEICILMIFFLLRYDWRFEPGYDPPKVGCFEHNRVFPAHMLIQAKRRKEEIDLINPKVSK